MSDILFIIKIFLEDKETYLQYREYLSHISNLDDSHKLLLKIIDTYYEEYDTNSIEKENLLAYVELNYSLVKNKKVILEFIDKLYELNTNRDLLKDILRNLADKHLAARLTDKLYALIEGSTAVSLHNIKLDLEEHLSRIDSELEDAGDNTLCSSSMVDLVTRDIKRQGLDWHLPFLTQQLGPLVGSSLIHVYARPNSGKTSFMCHLASYLAYQCRRMGEGDILHFNNEQEEGIIRKRHACSLLNKNAMWVKENPEEADRLLSEKGFDRIKLYGPALTLDYIENRIRRHCPKAVIIDQGVKVSYPKQSDSQQERITRLYNHYRNLAHKYKCDIISVGQARDVEFRKKDESGLWLTMDDCDYSRTGLQGECDTMIGIGKTNNVEDDYLRYVAITKEKVGCQAHKVVCRFDVGTGRYNEINSSED